LRRHWANLIRPGSQRRAPREVHPLPPQQERADGRRCRPRRAPSSGASSRPGARRVIRSLDPPQTRESPSNRPRKQRAPAAAVPAGQSRSDVCHEPPGPPFTFAVGMSASSLTASAPARASSPSSSRPAPEQRAQQARDGEHHVAMRDGHEHVPTQPFGPQEVLPPANQPAGDGRVSEESYLSPADALP
jgi:hypothetical protein